MEERVVRGMRLGAEEGQSAAVQGARDAYSAAPQAQVLRISGVQLRRRRSDGKAPEFWAVQCGLPCHRGKRQRRYVFKYCIYAFFVYKQGIVD